MTPPPAGASAYPAAEPFDSRRLRVDSRHALYLEQFGRRDGVPVVFLHGGPGSGCRRAHARQFDPAVFRAVLFDQRGAGLSEPSRSLEDNTTQHLVDDIERIRRALEIERWMAVGGSWGSTLALAYAQRYPERVTGLVLRAVFLGTAEEVRWAFRDAAQTFRPELWRRFAELLPEEERADPIASYGRRLEHPDPNVHIPAARAWGAYEQALSELRPGPAALPDTLAGSRGGAAPRTPYVEWHYISRDFFLEPGQLLRDAWRLAGIPGIVTQGRYDLLCPPRAAAEIVEAWGSADLRIVAEAGHAVSDPPLGAALVAAIDEMGALLSGR